MKPVQIVLIEDNPGDVLLVEVALEENGIPCQLTRFENGGEAVRVLCAPAEANALVPDAILLDLNTSRTDDFQMLIELKQCPRLSQVPIAILSSSPESNDKHNAALQSVRYIPKPPQLEDFLATVGQAVKEMLRPSWNPGQL